MPPPVELVAADARSEEGSAPVVGVLVGASHGGLGVGIVQNRIEVVEEEVVARRPESSCPGEEISFTKRITTTTTTTTTTYTHALPAALLTALPAALPAAAESETAVATPFKSEGRPAVVFADTCSNGWAAAAAAVDPAGSGPKADGAAADGAPLQRRRGSATRKRLASRLRLPGMGRPHALPLPRNTLQHSRWRRPVAGLRGFLTARPLPAPTAAGGERGAAAVPAAGGKTAARNSPHAKRTALSRWHTATLAQ